MDFFDPNSHASTRFEMGSVGHGALVLVLFAILGLMIAFRQKLPMLRDNRLFMEGTAALVLGLELAAAVSKFVYPCEPSYERYPLHLCASLKLAISILILWRRYDLVKYLSIWSIGAGFISFANLNLGGGSFGNFAFWHYLIGHYYLFAIPIFLFLTGDFRYDFKYHARSMGGLAAWSLLIFFINWAFDANYMYSGPHNEVQVAFIPSGWMIWPFNYFSYLVVGVVLLSTIFTILVIAQGRLEAAPAGMR